VCSAREADAQFCSGNVKDIMSAIRYASHHVEFRDCPICAAPAGPRSCSCVQWELVSDRSYEQLPKKAANFKMRFQGQYEGFIRSCYLDPITSSLVMVPGIATSLSATNWVEDQRAGAAKMIRLLIQDGLTKHVPANLTLVPHIERESFIDLTSKCPADTISAATIPSSNSGGRCVPELNISLLLSSGGCDAMSHFSVDGGASSVASHVVPLLSHEEQQQPFLLLDGLGSESPDQIVDDLEPLTCDAEQKQTGVEEDPPQSTKALAPPRLSLTCSQKPCLQPIFSQKMGEASPFGLHAPCSPRSAIAAAAAAAAACASAAVYRAAGFDPENLPSTSATYDNVPWPSNSIGSPIDANLTQLTPTAPPLSPALGSSPQPARQPESPLADEESAKAEERERKAYARKLRNRVAALRSNQKRSLKYKKLISDVTKRRDNLTSLQKRQAALRAENTRLLKAAGQPVEDLGAVKTPSSFPPLSPASEADDIDDGSSSGDAVIVDVMALGATAAAHARVVSV
jgi:hypothetical protein